MTTHLMEDFHRTSSRRFDDRDRTVRTGSSYHVAWKTGLGSTHASLVLRRNGEDADEASGKRGTSVGRAGFGSQTAFTTTGRIPTPATRVCCVGGMLN